MLTCRAAKRFVLADAVCRLVGTEAITASLRCCRSCVVFADIAVGFPDFLPVALLAGSPVAWFAVCRVPHRASRRSALLWKTSALGHRRCRSRVACTSPKAVGLLGFATSLPSRKALAYSASFELTLHARLSSRSWGFSPPACAFGSLPCCTSPIDRLCIAKDSRGIHCRLPSRLASRPSQSDSRVVAHNERVVGNGCHTASSTRTSLGVPALQGFTSSILHVRFCAYRQTCAWLRISPVLPSHA